jgi:hypothetical protein
MVGARVDAARIQFACQSRESAQLECAHDSRVSWMATTAEIAAWQYQMSLFLEKGGYGARAR